MDDEPQNLISHAQFFQNEGMEVIVASTASKMKEAFSKIDIDIAVLDVDMMPRTKIDRIKESQELTGLVPYVPEEGQGFEVAQWIRKNHPATIVMFLSAQRTNSSDKISGLTLGADDYLPKTTSIDEMYAIIKSRLRRVKNDSRRYAKIGNVIFDRIESTIKGQQETVWLTPSESRVLWMLAQAAPKVLYKAEITKELFNNIPSDRAIDTLIMKVRRKLERFDLYDVIDTLKGRGYTLKLSVSLS